MTMMMKMQQQDWHASVVWRRRGKRKRETAFEGSAAAKDTRVKTRLRCRGGKPQRGQEYYFLFHERGSPSVVSESDSSEQKVFRKQSPRDQRGRARAPARPEEGFTTSSPVNPSNSSKGEAAEPETS
ncbi:hypothetical protein EYF80_043113 [Liparis tanakae]|uniref:Uncharacterized protein n=1 Tax=Liparis tanakae TaxID=230148 RepID=A0A4Z2G0R0_9TELE|nr:hypothetical protein EYF80_043113 [Liparis tanakae]